eukprot:gnl/MRDRNA2_/MRDRNA2_79977_c0_seq1.p1 gnl/MRDRNA2_/MRDRNA2_79977_c0~~gnl/MRDRNA2_/MRDRNA2_79977_c0_seq1.p1  ORF type:complete len:119 (-),score=12.66 gnl/MRDRNA2_/MRDRNA2_79977_c0_seq1:618-974(-)
MVSEEVRASEESGVDASHPVTAATEGSSDLSSSPSAPPCSTIWKRLGGFFLLVGFILFVLHMILGVIGVGGSYGDDGSGGIIGIIFIGCVVLGCGSYGILGVLTSKKCALRAGTRQDQ